MSKECKNFEKFLKDNNIDYVFLINKFLVSHKGSYITCVHPDENKYKVLDFFEFKEIVKYSMEEAKEEILERIKEMGPKELSI